MQVIARDDLFIQRWTDRGTAEHLRRLIELHVGYLARRAPDKTLQIVHVATDNIAVPDPSIREIIAEHTRAIDAHCQATAVVLATQGFGASIVRGLLSLATAVRRSSYPHRVFSAIPDAVPWLVRQRPAPRDDASELIAWYTETERTLSA